jgi:3-oxochol-4-en-24-oyl-CoA dehydrogenase
MGIALTDEHRELEKVASSFLSAQKARMLARELLDAPTESLPTFWPDLAGLGWLGLHVPEQYGGSGYGLLELCVVTEQLGRAVAPGPFLPTVIASSVIAVRGSVEQRNRLLPGLIDGTVVAAVSPTSNVALRDGFASGDAGVVLGAGLADILLIGIGDDVVVLEASGHGVTIDVPANVDPTRRSGRVTLDAVSISDEQVISDAASYLLAVTRLLVAAEAVGGAQDCLDAAVGYAKVREQFGRTIGTFQAIKHHLSNMLVAAEAAVATVWDAARTAEGSAEQFQLMAGCAAVLAIPAYVHNAELNIQIHGGIGYTWEHDAHLHLRRAVTMRAMFGGDAPARDVFTLASQGITRENFIDLPPEADELRAQVAAEVAQLVRLDDRGRRDRLIETGYLMPHWPKPWGRAAGAVEQLVIDEVFAAHGIKRPNLSITGWVVFTLIQHGTPEQIERFVYPALRGDEVWCQLFSEPDAGSDAAGVKTRAVRVDGGWKINGQKVWTSLAQNCQCGLATVRTDPDAPKHAGITTMIIDMSAPGVQVRPLRQITGSAEFNEVFFTDVFVPDAHVLGEPNAGWTVARATLGNERVSLGGGSPVEGAAEFLVKLAARCDQNVEGARPRAGRFVARDHALRLLNLRQAVRSIVGGEPGPGGNVTKLLVAEHMSERATFSAELLGPDVALVAGQARKAGVMVLAARGMSIAGGTSEVTRNQIAERILGMPRDPLIA